jgi:uncharacterized protein YecE (DUF72 family)
VANDPAIQSGVIHIGCAGWSLPKEHAPEFPRHGTHLQRYAERLPAVEINSSFYRPHRPTTYERWAASVPTYFRFAVKFPRVATHDHRLVRTDDVSARFFAESTMLGEKLGPVLVQLPPSLPFEAAIAVTFFGQLRERFKGKVVLEPRHRSWFTEAPEQLLIQHRIARVAADPAVVPAAATPGGWNGWVYYRLHGSPKMYYSAYSAGYLQAIAKKLMAASRRSEVWCIFDNTAEGAAIADALALLQCLRADRDL